MENFETNKPESIEEKERALISVKEELKSVQEDISKAKERVVSILDELKSVVGDTEKELELLKKIEEEEEAMKRLDILNTSLDNQVEDLLEELTEKIN